jgi:hypothetical protein
VEALRYLTASYLMSFRSVLAAIATLPHRSRVFPAALVFATAACGSSSSARPGFTDDAGAPSGTFGDGSAGTVQPTSECAADTQQIYVVTRESDLYRFAPQTRAFKRVGSIDCAGANGATPFSMAVDRHGTAWVLFNDGHLYTVSTVDARCSSTAYAPDQSNFHTFGMAYVSDTTGGNTETLYVADYDAKGLARIDPTQLKLTFIAPYSGFSAAGELTGRGDARMFAFFNKTATVSDVRVAEIDPKTASILTTHTLAGLDVGSGWAFAHWGGDFWLFTAPGGSSQVTQYSFDKDTSTTVAQDLGFVIVGAGVSTCAPLAPPK